VPLQTPKRRAIRSLAGGVFKITGSETNRTQKALQRWGMATLTGAGAAWTAADAMTFWHDIGPGTGNPAWDMASVLLKGAFTYGAFNTYPQEFNTTHARAMQGPGKRAVPAALVGGVLTAAMIIQLIAR
jgi:hypothetical protein